MKPALVSIFLLLGLCACSDRASSAAAYKNPWDRVAIRLGYAGWGYEPCFRKETGAYGDVLVFIGSEACFHFNPPERMRGIWLNEFEGSAFLLNATVPPADWTYSTDAIWLEFTGPEPLLSDGHPAYVIEFVGRRATYSGHYGHLGGSRHMVIVDKVLSATPVRPSERQQ